MVFGGGWELRSQTLPWPSGVREMDPGAGWASQHGGGEDSGGERGRPRLEDEGFLEMHVFLSLVLTLPK